MGVASLDYLFFFSITLLRGFSRSAARYSPDLVLVLSDCDLGFPNITIANWDLFSQKRR